MDAQVLESPHLRVEAGLGGLTRKGCPSLSHSLRPGHAEGLRARRGEGLAEPAHLGQPPSLIPALPASMSAPLCLLSAWSQRDAVKTKSRARAPLLPILQGCSLHPGAAAQHLCCLGISCTLLSLRPCRHASPSPTTGPLPMLRPLPEMLFSRCPLGLASFRFLLICEYLPFKHLDPLHPHFYPALPRRG